MKMQKRLGCLASVEQTARQLLRGGRRVQCPRMEWALAASSALRRHLGDIWIGAGLKMALVLLWVSFYTTDKGYPRKYRSLFGV